MKLAIISVLLFHTIGYQEKDVTVVCKGKELEGIEVGILSELNDNSSCSGDEITIWLFPIEGDTVYMKDVPCHHFLNCKEMIINIDHKESHCTKAVLHNGEIAIVIGKRRETKCSKKVNTIHLFMEEADN